MPRRLHRNMELEQKLRTRYLAKILKEHPDIAEEDVLWIGPLSDGLVKFGLFRRRKGTDRGNWRTGIPDISYSSFITAIAPETERIAKGFYDTALEFQRGGEKATIVVLNRRAVDEEPGELLTSPVFAINEPGESHLEWDPKIREDKRHGLHFLLRNDVFWKRFRYSRNPQRKQEFVLEYHLRPLSEGSSLITPERQMDKAVAF